MCAHCPLSARAPVFLFDKLASHKIPFSERVPFKKNHIHHLKETQPPVVKVVCEKQKLHSWSSSNKIQELCPRHRGQTAALSNTSLRGECSGNFYKQKGSSGANAGSWHEAKALQRTMAPSNEEQISPASSSNPGIWFAPGDESLPSLWSWKGVSTLIFLSWRWCPLMTSSLSQAGPPCLLHFTTWAKGKLSASDPTQREREKEAV